ncbi:MAG: alpha/beta fold hydrolase [Gammaproteobacteria bacterium]
MEENSARGGKPPKGFERNEYRVNGVRTVVYSAGDGSPVVYLHGAGTFSGIDFARAWTGRFRVILPYHPGFGESADEPRMDSMNEYLLHYLELFQQLGLSRFHLVGLSMGGWMAAEFAVAHGHLLRKLVLAAPAGLLSSEYPLPNLPSITGDQIFSYLVKDLAVLQPCLPKNGREAAELAALMGRESQTAGRISGRGPFNPNLERWLHRITMPTLLIWPREDRLLPVGLSGRWMSLLPNARLELIEDCGHLVFDESAHARNLVAEFFTSD